MMHTNYDPTFNCIRWRKLIHIARVWSLFLSEFCFNIIWFWRTIRISGQKCFNPEKCHNTPHLPISGRLLPSFPRILWLQETVRIQEKSGSGFYTFSKHNWDYKVFAESRVKVNWNSNASNWQIIGSVFPYTFTYCCGQSLRCVPLRWSGSGSVIQDHWLESWCIKITDESVIRVDSSVPLMYHNTSDLGSLIRIRITSKERALVAGGRCGENQVYV